MTDKELTSIPKNIFNDKKIHFITYGDENFFNAKKTLIEEALDSNFFYSLTSYSKENLDEDFKEKNKEILNETRGGGYFIWRGHIIRKKLNEIENGEFIIYNDAGNTVNKKGGKKLLEYLNKLEKSQLGLLWFKTTYPERNWTVKEIFDFFKININSKLALEGQFWIGCLIIQKNNNSIRLFDEYLKVLEKESKLFTDFYNNKNQKKYFVENRHDQSILSIISKLYGCVSIQPPNKHDVAFECAEVDEELPFWNTHRRNGKDYNSLSNNYNGGLLYKNRQ